MRGFFAELRMASVERTTARARTEADSSAALRNDKPRKNKRQMLMRGLKGP
jgi:hypothetical protein